MELNSSLSLDIYFSSASVSLDVWESLEIK